MPTNRYTCCDKDWEWIGPSKPSTCPTCGALVEPQLPRNISSPSVFETVDKGKNVRWRENFEERAKKRNAAGSKHGAKERARVHGEDPQKHGITEDDPRLV